MQRFIREVNTTSRSCVLWDLEEETDYIIQVQSIGLYGESQASKKVHFRTLKKSDRFPSNSSNQGKQLWEYLPVAKFIWLMVFLFSGTLMCEWQSRGLCLQGFNQRAVAMHIYNNM